MEIFKGQNLIEFAERFRTDQDCREYLSKIKWSEQYVCRKCGHTKSQKRKDFARTCNICSDTESATANTLFHKVKFGLKKHFLFVLKCQLVQKVFQLHKLLFVLVFTKEPQGYLCIKCVRL